jgi:hypothetical protein
MACIYSIYMACIYSIYMACIYSIYIYGMSQASSQFPVIHTTIMPTQLIILMFYSKYISATMPYKIQNTKIVVCFVVVLLAAA